LRPSWKKSRNGRSFFESDFQREFSKIRHETLKEQLRKQISKIADNPEIGKPMRNQRKGTRELYVGSHRLSYRYLKEEDIVVFLDYYHKDEQ
jgi:mRNA-degrading endonuclease RelE of RelBE toxin-antitoxin system